MEIRLLSGKERFDAHLISAYCFHYRMDDENAGRENIENGTDEDWGAFNDDGTLMAHIINNKFNFYVDGQTVRAGGIGAVSTLPEYRESGAVKEIFRKLLPAAYRDGEVISALYPFNHAFYRKQGYEVVTHQNVYELNPALLSGFTFTGKVTHWNPGEDTAAFAEVYNAFARNYNMTIPREEKQMNYHVKAEKLYKERKFSYLLSENEQNIAYVIFRDLQNKQAVLHVEETAWTCPAGFRAIMAFLSRFTADFGKVELTLPAGIDLLRIIRTPRAYEIKKTTRQDFMVRVINAEKLLEVIRKPMDCDFTIRISDEKIEENNGTWRVTHDAVTRIDKVSCGTSTDANADVVPDLIVSERSFAQMAIGGINLDEAMLKDDVCVRSNEEMLRRVFTEKKIFVGEHF